MLCGVAPICPLWDLLALSTTGVVSDIIYKTFYAQHYKNSFTTTLSHSQA
jgi:hypothetical protein